MVLAMPAAAVRTAGRRGTGSSHPRARAAAALALVGWAHGAAAQMTDRLMSVEPIDASSPRTVAGLMMLAVGAVLAAAVLSLLHHRRKMFPIAGRSAHLLLGLNGLLALINVLSSSTFFLMPEGLSCGVQYCMSWLFMPFVLLWLVRAWLLVYRLEICNYLSELAWRQSKIAQITARQTESGDAEPPITLPSLEPASIEGSWFIRNRRFTERRWIATALCAVVPFNVLAFVLPIFFDADIGLVDAWRDSNGYARLEARSQFTGGAFLHSPRCFWYSIKLCIYFGITGCMMPYAFWAAWRVYLSSKRMQRRVQEQAEFAAAMASSKSSHVAPPAVVSHSAASSDLDETHSVKREMVLTILFGGVLGMPMVILETAIADAWVCMHWWLLSMLCLSVTGVEPVITSYRVAAKQREMFRKARSAGGGGTAVGGRSKFVAQIAHHRQLYRLQHLLHDSFAYPLLLKFLQKEYSSENALFCREARAFGQTCKALESLLPGWRSTVDEDDDTTGGHLLSSFTSADAGRVLQSTAVSLIAPPNVQVNKMMQSAPAPAPAACPSKRNMHPTGARVAPAPSCAVPGSANLAIDGPQPATATGSQQSSMALPFGGRVSGTVSSHADGARLLRSSYDSAVAGPILPRSPQRSAKLSRASSQASANVVAQPPRAFVPPQTLSFRVMHERVAKARDWALKIHADYLQSNAVYQINIDSDLSRLVASQVAQLRLWEPTPLDAEGQPDFERAAMESAPPTPPPFPLSSLYKQTALSVFNLMETDSFRRFLLTSDFQLLLQRADDEEMARLQHATAAAADTTMILARADAAFNLAQSPTAAAAAAAATATAAAAAAAAAAAGHSPRLQIVSVHSGDGVHADGGVAGGSVLQHVRHVEQLQIARPSISANHSTLANAAALEPHTAIEPASPVAEREPISPLPS